MSYVVNKETAPHRDTGWGEHIYPFATAEQGQMKYNTVAYIEIDPGKTTKNHYHPVVEETYYILSGQSKVMLDDDEVILHPGDLVTIPANVKHKLFNLSSDEKLTLIATCAPQWTEDCTVFLE